MATITKPVNEVQVGDVVEWTDGFDLTPFYVRVTEPIAMDHAVRASGTDSWFVLIGERRDTGAPWEMYVAPGDSVEVAVLGKGGD